MPRVQKSLPHCTESRQKTKIPESIENAQKGVILRELVQLLQLILMMYVRF